MPEGGELDARRTIMELLSHRAAEATVCPSEVARALAGKGRTGIGDAGWRELMPGVHAAVDGLLADDAIGLSWKGRSLRTRSGPYRIASRSS